MDLSFSTKPAHHLKRTTNDYFINKHGFKKNQVNYSKYPKLTDIWFANKSHISLYRIRMIDDNNAIVAGIR